MALTQTELDQIAEAFSVELRRGLDPSVDEVVSKHGDDAALRELLESIVIIENIKRDSQLTPNRNHSSIDVDQLDDFQLIREIGRGGMGLVFEAEDQSLHRRVAIKVLPNSLLDDSRNLDRFRSEAAAAARLRHPNIVSVLGVGFAQNHHYYVMDYIAGVNLKQWLQTLFHQAGEEVPTLHSQADSNATFEIGSQPTASARTATQIVEQVNIPTDIHSATYAKWVSKVGLAICKALYYAHSESILHRDIKPANLLLDMNGNVLLADFGLAKVAGSVDMTRTGDVMGTPQYMAPESLSGNHDERSEVYAVGLTLFELLTARPAISSPRTAEVIRLAAQGVRVKPSKWNPHIPKPLETIILKALAFDPSDRYQNANELAGDLENFLTDRPINARKSSLPERLYRWSKREPLVASLSGLTLGSLLTLVLVSGVAFFRTRAALKKANQSQTETLQALKDRSEALTSAELQRERAELNLAVAIKAFDEIQERIWQRGMLPDAEFLGEGVETSSSAVSDSDAEILRTLLVFFDELAETNSGAVEVESAAAARRMGDIYQILGQLSEAQRAYANASTRYKELSDPDIDEFKVERAKLLNEQIIVSSLRGQVISASSFFQEVRNLLESDPDVASTPAGKFELARSNLLFATILARAGVEPMTLKRFRNSNRRPTLARGINSRFSGEWEAINLAVSLLSELTEEFPKEPKYQIAIARALREQSVLAFRGNRPEEAETQIKQSIETLENMLTENPSSASIRYELARTLASSEAMSINQIFRIGRADTLSADLLKEFPDLARYQELRARILASMATNRAWGRIKDADAYLEEALSLWDGLIKDADLPQYRVEKSETLAAMADRQLRSGNRAKARELLQFALDTVSLGPRSSLNPIRIQQQKIRSKMTRLNDRATLGPGKPRIGNPGQD